MWESLRNDSCLVLLDSTMLVQLVVQYDLAAYNVHITWRVQVPTCLCWFSLHWMDFSCSGQLLWVCASSTFVGSFKGMCEAAIVNSNALSSTRNLMRFAAVCCLSQSLLLRSVFLVSGFRHSRSLHLGLHNSRLWITLAGIALLEWPFAGCISFCESSTGCVVPSLLWLVSFTVSCSPTIGAASSMTGGRRTSPPKVTFLSMLMCYIFSWYIWWPWLMPL